MSVLGIVIKWILGLGAAIFVPIIIIIAGLIVGMKIKDAISAGITLGVAFTGMSMLIGFMSDAIGPAAKAMLTHTGINLPIVDGGWTTLSAIAWSWPYAFLMFPLMIGLNIVMLIINKTKTFNADLWNVWGKIFTGVAVAAVSKPYFGTAASIALAFIVAGIQIIFELKMADMYQYRIEKLSGIPGVTCTHKMGFTSIFMFPIDCVLKKIPALNKRFDAAALKDKIGIFAESHVLGFILGIIFGILAKYKVAAILTLGIQASCALTLFPVISKYFMMALEPISSAISAFMNKTQSFFPNLAGVTAQAQYKGKELQGMHVNITTQFYSMTEITSFTQFVSQMARTYLPSGVPVDITIKGSDGTVQAFLSRDSGQNSYYTHVFNSY